MAKSKKQYRLYSKSNQEFHYGGDLYGKINCDNSSRKKDPKSWKTFAPLIEAVERLCGARRFRWQSAETDVKFDMLDDLEFVEYEVILKEVRRMPATEIVTERLRERMIRNEMGYHVCAMYTKMRIEGLEDFRYILAFNDYTSFDDAKIRLKELDIMHGRNYRFCRYAMIFKDANDAILTKLTFADDTSEVYDIENLKALDIEEEYTDRG